MDPWIDEKNVTYHKKIDSIYFYGWRSAFFKLLQNRSKDATSCNKYGIGNQKFISVEPNVRELPLILLKKFAEKILEVNSDSC
jgi:hypothetical protein